MRARTLENASNRAACRYLRYAFRLALVGLQISAAAFILGGCALTAQRVDCGTVSALPGAARHNVVQATRSGTRWRIAVPPKFKSLRDVTAGLRQLELEFCRAGDRRGPFASLQLELMRTLHQRLRHGDCCDREWFEKYIVEMGELYRYAVERYEAGDRAHVPQAWLTAFDWSLSGQSLVIEDILLAINAHACSDLPHALATVGTGHDNMARHMDHSSVTSAIEEAEEAGMERVTQLYWPGYRRINKILVKLGQRLFYLELGAMRELAWREGCSLEASSECEKAEISTFIEEYSEANAERIIAPHRAFPLLFEHLSAEERF